MYKDLLDNDGDTSEGTSEDSDDEADADLGSSKGGRYSPSFCISPHSFVRNDFGLECCGVRSLCASG